MKKETLEYLINFICEVLDIPNKVKQEEIVVISEEEKEIKIHYGPKNFNVKRLTYKRINFYCNKIPNSNLSLYIPHKHLSSDIWSTTDSSTKTICKFIKYTCEAASRVDMILSRERENINHYELLELIKRLSIPELLHKIYSEQANRLADSLSDSIIIDYGRLIRDLLKWGNSTIEGKKIKTGLIIAESVERLKNVAKNSTFKNHKIEIITLESNENLYDFKSIKSLLEVVDGINSFLIGVPITSENIRIKGILVSEKGLMDDLMNNNKKGFNAPVFSLRENGLRIGRGNQLIMEYVKNSPRIRNYSKLLEVLKKELELKTEISSKLASLILEISHYGKGTTLVFGYRHDYENDVEKTHWIKPRKIRFDAEKVFTDVLVNFSKTDGAVLINKELEIVGFGSILKATAAKARVSGGSRHKSMASFSHKKDILGIVISEDGPISVIKNNQILISL
ncbi:DNA integrity scanning protein DisA nucleotide-binding domain protein [Priestia aryabhattai]|uniref:DNA integrity scanning protein DisA nucleotide-binding domain protein n=1 Tax=Priestia aryabhattai TaxID=412384 RepID=UPI001CFB85B2|nr:DNA integrity scanning protein DisA nucleotide-binding domain protein [Priestia aryabhattai]